MSDYTTREISLELVAELKAEVERLTNQLDGKYQIMEKQLAIIKERDAELQALKDRVDNAPITTLPRNQLVGALMPEPKGDGEYISYRLVEIKGGE